MTQGSVPVSYTHLDVYKRQRYNGWQRQGNTPDTVQGRLETALSALLGQPVEVAGSGRTDAGCLLYTSATCAAEKIPLGLQTCALSVSGGRRVRCSQAAPPLSKSNTF